MTRKVLTILAYLTAASAALPAFAGNTLFSEDPIPEECAESYTAGTTFIRGLVEEGTDLSDGITRAEIFDTAVNEHPSDSEICRFSFSMGMFDAFTGVQQAVLAEYALDLDLVERESRLANRLRYTIRSYTARLRTLGYDPQMLADFYANRVDRAVQVRDLTTRMNKLADEEQKAVRVGRFVFVGNRLPYYTMTEVQLDENGEPLIDEEGRTAIGPGSYPQIAYENWQRTVKTAEAYANWIPSLFFGEDSYWYGSFWRYFGVDRGPSVREVKEEGFFDAMQMHRRFAHAMRLDMTPYNKIYQGMIDKQRAEVQSTVDIYQQMAEKWWVPLAIPAAMYAGGVMLAQSGWFAPIQAGSFAYVGGSLTLASNVAAASSLLAITAVTGIGVHQALKDYRSAQAQGAQFRISHALDRIFHATLQSFKVAVAAPIVVGGTVLAAQQLIVSGRWLLTNGLKTGRMVSELGVRGALRQAGQHMIKELPKRLAMMPKTVWRQWLAGWWKQPKLIAAEVASDWVLTIGFEVGYRQWAFEGKDKFVYVDEHGQRRMNSQALYSLGGLLISTATKPMMFIKSPVNRWLSYRALDFSTSLFPQLIIKGTIDENRFVFDQTYGATVGMVIGEMKRSMKLSDFVLRQSSARQLALLTFLRLASSSLETPQKIKIRDAIVTSDDPIGVLRAMALDTFYYDLSDFTDAEFRASLAAATMEDNDPELLREIKAVMTRLEPVTELPPQ